MSTKVARMRREDGGLASRRIQVEGACAVAGRVLGRLREDSYEARDSGLVSD